MGYEFWPAALESVIRRTWSRTGGRSRLYVTENGLATEDDKEPIVYVRRALQGVLRAVNDDIDVAGYTYWSLLDNFEWAFGYVPHFDIVGVDPATFDRRPEPSAHWFASLVAANAVDQDRLDDSWHGLTAAWRRP